MECMLLFLVALSLILSGVILFLHLRDKDRQIEQLRNDLDRIRNERDEQKQKMTDLLDRKRQTGPTMAAAEDAMSAIANVIVNRDIEQVRLNAALNYLQDLRKGPYAYKPDQATGPREEYK